MGNEQSQMSGLVVEEKAIEVADFYTHHSATLNAGNSVISAVSIFIGEPLVGGSFWLSQTPLEKASKNLMLHRHPCILRYVSSWSKGSKYYLAVEKVKPLLHVLQSQSILQVCIGLHSILKALVFLHERALASHNNVCTASIYVTKDGDWKLGGLEYLSKFKDITKDYMRKARSHRYEKAIDPNEEKHLDGQRLDFIDIYAFAVLVNEVFHSLKGCNDDSIALDQFLDVCKNDLHHLNAQQRPKLSTLLEDAFFNHDFITTHAFLVELPLKSDLEKDAFFSGLIQRLGNFKPQIVAKQLGGLLLSRMVLLNKTAQAKVIPELFTLKENNPNALFDAQTFREHIVPTLLEIFGVRDAQIRLLLLEYFNHFIGCFSKEQLQNKILPELLLGIKDTNDQLVSVTLRALADLVPLLGSAIVIGDKRAKLFNDGMPITRRPTVTSARRNSTRSSTRHINAALPFATAHTIRKPEILSNSSGTETHADLILNERPSPDGEEGDTSTITDECVEDNQMDADGSISSPSNEAWDDWDINDAEANDSPLRETSSHGGSTNLSNLTSTTISSLSSVTLNQKPDSVALECAIESSHLVALRNDAPQLNARVDCNRKIELPDILALDIKNVKNNANSEEFDFFQDMEPVINTTSKYFGSNKMDALVASVANSVNTRSTFDWSVNASTKDQEEGWADGLDEWE